MNIIGEVLSYLKPLDQAFSRSKTKLNFMLLILGFIITSPGRGIAGILSELKLKPNSYQSLLDFFSSDAVNLSVLKNSWIKFLIQDNMKLVYTVNNKKVIITDGKKTPKSGKRMPGVKTLTQTSSSNSKPETITGHYWEQVSLLMINEHNQYKAIPILRTMADGVKINEEDQETTHDVQFKMLRDHIDLLKNSIEVTDAGYMSFKHLKEKEEIGISSITRCRKNAVANIPLSKSLLQKRGKGRPVKYGELLKLKSLFYNNVNIGNDFNGDLLLKRGTVEVELYGKSETVKYWTAELICKKYSEDTPIKFVGVELNGNAVIFLSTDLELSVKQIIELYGMRFSIEIGFKEGISSSNQDDYKFWAKGVKKAKKDKNWYTDKISNIKFHEKVRGYEIYAACTAIAQGCLQLISLKKSPVVWRHLPKWLRTIRLNNLASENVVKSVVEKEYYDLLQNGSTRFFLKNDLIKMLNNCAFLLDSTLEVEKKAA